MSLAVPSTIQCFYTFLQCLVVPKDEFSFQVLENVPAIFCNRLFNSYKSFFQGIVGLQSTRLHCVKIVTARSCIVTKHDGMLESRGAETKKKKKIALENLKKKRNDHHPALVHCCLCFHGAQFECVYEFELCGPAGRSAYAPFPFSMWSMHNPKRFVFESQWIVCTSPSQAPGKGRGHVYSFCKTEKRKQRE